MEEFLTSGMHWRLLNFALFVGLLFFLLRKPVKEFWAARSHEVRLGLEEAAREWQEARQRHEDLKGRVSRLESEAGDLIRRLEKDGEEEKDHRIAQAEALARRIREDSARIATQEVRKAQEILKATAVQLSVEIAERLIRENFEADDQKKRADRYLTDIAREVG